MTNWIITSSVLILIMIAARSLFKGHISPLLQYALWLIVLVRLVVPFNPLESSISVLNAVPTSLSAASGVTKNTENLTPETFTAAPAADYTAADSATADSAVAHTETDIFDAPKITTSVSAQSGLLSFSFVLGTLWLTGTAALLIYALIRNYRLARFLHRTRRPYADGVYVAPALPSSCLFGILKPTIYITEAVACDRQSRRHVLAHEQAHRRHGDHIWNLLRIVVLALHWYNPLVWGACALSKRDAEMAADTAAIAALAPQERFDYGETLLNMLDFAAPRDTWFSCSTTMITTKRALRERINAIVKNAHTAVSMAVIVLMMAIAVVGCTFTGAEDDSATDSDETMESNEIVTEKVTSVSDYASLSPSELRTTRIAGQEILALMTTWLEKYHDISTEDSTETLKQWIEESETLTPSMVEEVKMIQTSDGCYIGYVTHDMMKIKDVRKFLNELKATLNMDLADDYHSNPSVTNFYLAKPEQYYSYYYYFTMFYEEILRETDPRVTDPTYVDPVLEHEHGINTGRSLVDAYAKWLALEADLTNEETSDRLLQLLTDSEIDSELLTDYYMLELSDGSMIGFLIYNTTQASKQLTDIQDIISEYAGSLGFMFGSSVNLEHPDELFFTMYPDKSHLLYDYFELDLTIRHIENYRPTVSE